jgi:hypothetical protein
MRTDLADPAPESKHLEYIHATGREDDATNS